MLKVRNTTKQVFSMPGGKTKDSKPVVLLPGDNSPDAAAWAYAKTTELVQARLANRTFIEVDLTVTSAKKKP